MKRTLYCPARPGLKIPMPDRGNRLMPDTGAPVDIHARYYAQLLADRDIEKAPVERPAEKETAPAPRARKK
jgi:hypothetical protein